MMYKYEGYFPKLRNEVYLENYKRFINKRLNRVLTNKKIERHHIVPCSFIPSTISDEDKGIENLISLTYEEHYIAHFLLYKAFKSRKMVSAFWMMSNKKKYTLIRLGAKDYSKFKEDYFELNSERATRLNKRNWSDPEYKEKMSEKFKEGWKKRREKIASGELPRKKMPRLLKGESKSLDRVWVNNSKENKFIKKEEVNVYLKQGFTFGMIRKWPKEQKDKLIERRKREKWVNDGIKNFHIDQDLVEDWLNKGFKLGFLKALKEENKEAYSERRKNMTTINNGIRDFVVDNYKLSDYFEKGYIVGSIRRGKKRSKKKV